MKDNAWPTFLFTDLLKPPDGWRTDYAILSTYSADLIVIVTALLALTGCDLDNRHGSRVELVNAIETLRGRVRVLAQVGRLVNSGRSRPILKLLDQFVKAIDSDENLRSWHLKAALVRYNNLNEVSETQWRIWLGSLNLTRSQNWEAGLMLASRPDGKGLRVDGLAAAGEALARRARLPGLTAKDIGAELATLTWECPPGCEVRSIKLLGPGFATGLPAIPNDTERMFIVSPFLDEETVRKVAQCGGVKTRRSIVSTTMELQRLLHKNKAVFTGFNPLLTQPLPDLPAEGADLREEENTSGSEVIDDEMPPPPGLHAKLLFAAKGARRQLWLGSANATERGWQGRNFELVAELVLTRGVADAVEAFVAGCEIFRPAASPPEVDPYEESLEKARKSLSGKWPLRQRISDAGVEIIAREPPPLTDSAIELEVSILGGSWSRWPRHASHVLLAKPPHWQRSDFLQIRVSLGDRKCTWLQIAPCEPPPDSARDQALIAEYLDPHTFLLWLRSMLADYSAGSGGGDWDGDDSGNGRKVMDPHAPPEEGVGPSIEEILRSWSRDPSSFAAADDKVRSYMGELQRRAAETGATADFALLEAFRHTWDVLALEFR